MDYTVGCDIVHIPDFARSAYEGGEQFLDKVFVSSERSLAHSIDSLAGYFAIKESVIKAIGTKIAWTDIIIYKDDSGKPAIKLPLTYSLYQTEVSVSHHGEYAIAMALLTKPAI